MKTKRIKPIEVAGVLRPMEAEVARAIDVLARSEAIQAFEEAAQSIREGDSINRKESLMFVVEELGPEASYEAIARATAKYARKMWRALPKVPKEGL
jgi:hypothetical protein